MMILTLENLKKGDWLFYDEDYCLTYIAQSEEDPDFHIMRLNGELEEWTEQQLDLDKIVKWSRNGKALKFERPPRPLQPHNWETRAKGPIPNAYRLTYTGSVDKAAYSDALFISEDPEELEDLAHKLKIISVQRGLKVTLEDDSEEGLIICRSDDNAEWVASGVYSTHATLYPVFKQENAEAVVEWMEQHYPRGLSRHGQ